MRPYIHKVQYYETDQMGIVHHSNYIRWFEEARIDMLDQIDSPYDKMEEMGIISPVVNVEADYLRMVRFGEKVAVIATIQEYNGIKLAISYKVISDKTKMVHCKGVSRHCFLNEKGRPVSLKKECPELHEKFCKAFEEFKMKKKK